MVLAQQPTLLGVCRGVVDDYLRQAPRYRGVLSNFLRQDSNGVARAEIAFQASPALARLARHTKERRYAATAVEQILLLDHELRDAATGLWFLGRGASGRTPSLWGRGCAFSLRGVVDTLAELDADRADRAKLLAILKRMAGGLRRLQGKDGDWRQITNEPQSRPESSATAWTVAGLAKAVRLGWLGPEFRPCIERGWRAVKRRVWDGLATRICGSVTASMDPEYYRSRPFLSPGYGHFALLAAIEVGRLRKLAAVSLK
jgi:unsaturated rhamnogalacturonyl hydrolase